MYSIRRQEKSIGETLVIIARSQFACIAVSLAVPIAGVEYGSFRHSGLIDRQCMNIAASVNCNHEPS